MASKNFSSVSSAERPVVQAMIDYIRASPSPFHCVDTSVAMLQQAGFKQLSERNTNWDIQPNGRYFITRNQSTIVAFAVGGQFRPGNGFVVIGAHTDSPCLRLKPNSKVNQSGFLQVGVQPYGGGLWHTWFDRDLSVAGRVIVANPERTEFHARTVRIAKPILRIPMLAIHLNRSIRSDGFKPNAQDHLYPVLATEVKTSLLNPQPDQVDENGRESHHAVLVQLLADELEVQPEQISDFELSLYDTQDACIGGALDEFVFAPRLDNQGMSYVALASLIDSLDSLENESTVRTICLFDNEEVGSTSNRGANSSTLSDVMKRVTGPDHQAFLAAMSNSICISADMAHAVHPNYASKHDPKHAVQLHKGLVIKHNVNERYATTAVSAFLLAEVAKRHSIDIQSFVIKSDLGCGSTIGPMLSSNCGMRTVDVGCPMLSMHSIREMCGTKDIQTTKELFTRFFEEFAALDATVHVDDQ